MSLLYSSGDLRPDLAEPPFMLNVRADTVEVCATASAVISIGVRPKVSFDGSFGMCVD